ncbi:YMGG-like glycine zipper-containing protein [Roseibacillus persicicus]|uniref:YMGG-like glycine zipper-containing protein n=1 Tax=Roseibacillus persicicus TaxID=454148 RepID=UPI00398B45BF
MKKTITASLAVVSAIALSNCAPQNNMQRDAATGAAGGAVLGGIIGNNVGDGNAARGAAIGAALGGLGGAAVGNNKDMQQGGGYTGQPAYGY